MRQTPGGALPHGSVTRVTQGGYEGWEGTIIGDRSVNGTLTEYRVVIKRPEDEPGMEIDTYVPAGGGGRYRLVAAQDRLHKRRPTRSRLRVGLN